MNGSIVTRTYRTRGGNRVIAYGINKKGQHVVSTQWTGPMTMGTIDEYPIYYRNDTIEAARMTWREIEEQWKDWGYVLAGE